MDSSFNETLVPPLGTSFYKRKTFNVFDGRNFRGKTFFSVSWRVDAHIYATESPPSPGYQGTVYIIFVHYATLVAPEPMCYISEPTRFTVTPGDDSVRAAALEPQSWTKTTSLDQSTILYSSKIDFAQDFPMFNNGGAQEFTFSAAYSETTVGSLKHSGRIVGHQTEFSFDEIPYLPYPEENFRAISVFSTTKATGSLEFRFALENENYNITTKPGIPIVIDLFPLAAP
ncbi:hypothetical protein PC9H_002930 [Pleurotus ostreatus]|uniref:Uncharacterized protein n=2 Tax=Pleurotus ostreatus TaxID=5322 RepID=A0A067NWY7_PLEO1|nr:uncharacterized protein PC9H_002930 [Pleurotus ostreatus]KAF7436104.1 hypothetical protein PC9H_002930 [Pleurotus ostreatus]KAJ8701736.1 hypothetical protein PTI98_000493 [Pleurotus ostreatus]KDQ31510.1 hypothetical protein PLEOSDRAFT_1102474 [Pleurotus ostreatus PC15]